MTIALFRKPIAKNTLSVIAVPAFGFILLNLTFAFDFIFQSVIDGAVKLLTLTDSNMAWSWFPPVKHIAFVAIVGLVSWFVFRSKLGVLYKAIYMNVPLAVVFVTLGMFLFHIPLAAFLLGGLLVVGLLYYFYRTKQPWLYYYSLILVAAAIVLVGILGVEI
jgi:hypothetical protein